jgi:hypothetical protein
MPGKRARDTLDNEVKERLPQSRRRNAADPQDTLPRMLTTDLIVVGVDVGIRNLSLCKMKIEAGTPYLSAALTAVERATSTLPHVHVLKWDVVDIAIGKSVRSLCHTVMLDLLLAYFSSDGAEYLQDADAIVIESQITAKMKMISAGLYVLGRSMAPGAKVQFQSALKKLAYAPEDMETLCGVPISTATYAKRKKAAVSMCKALLSHLAVDNPDAATAHDHFHSSKKKDDLADSFLHALYHSVDALTSRQRR